MTDREVKVRFTGDSKQLDAATGGVEGRMSSLAGKIGSLAKGLLAFGGGLALGGLFKKAVDEATAAEVGMARLKKAVDNTTTSFASFSPQAEQVIDRLQRTTRATDDELRNALARLVTITGDATGSLRELSLVNDLAAFSGKSLEESAIVVGKAMVGNTKSLKEFGITTTDASLALDQLRGKVDGQAEAMSKGLGGALAQVKKQFGEVLEAIGTVIIGSENLTGGTSALADSLANLAQWIEDHEDDIRSFGNVLASIGGALGTMFRPMSEEIKNTGKIWRSLAKGEWAEFRKAFMAELGQVEKAGKDSTRRQIATQRDFYGEWMNAVKDFNTKQETAHKTSLKKRQDDSKKAQKEEIRIAEDGSAVIRDVLAKMHDANSQIAKDWEEIGKRAAATKDKIDLLVPATVELVEPLEESQMNALGLARSLIDAGQAMGGLNAEAASALTSVVNMVDSISRLGVDPLGGTIGIISGLANLIANWGSSAAEKIRKEILAKNTTAIERLTREFGNFNLGISGRAFAGAQEVFGGAAERAAELAGAGAPERLVGAAVLRRDILKQLAAKGITREQLEELFQQIGAPELGQFFTTTDPGLLFALIPQIIKALGATELGALGGGFEDQLAALEESFSVFGTEDADAKLAKLKELASKHSPAIGKALNVDLSTPEGIAAAVGNLQALYADLLASKLSPTEIGISGPQFRALINSLLGLLRGADTILPVGVTPVTTPPTTVPTGATSSLTIGAPEFSVPGGTFAPASIGTQIQGDVNISVGPITARADDDPRRLALFVAEEINRVLGTRRTSQLIANGEPVLSGALV